MRLFQRGRADDRVEGMRLVVGLGNPGTRYERTRHNVGFLVVDRIAARHEARWSGSKHAADVARWSRDGQTVLLAKPETFMNESGYAVARLSRYYRIRPEDMLVVCDDLDLPYGTIRLRPDGSSGGQRGLQSIIQSLGTTAFPRLRLGIGRPDRNAVEHVLERFTPTQEAILPALIDVAADAVEFALAEGVPAAMNRFNRDWLPSLTP